MDEAMEKNEHNNYYMKILFAAFTRYWFWKFEPFRYSEAFIEKLVKDMVIPYGLEKLEKQ